MRIRIRRHLPVSVYFVTIILGVAGGVYIWHPVLQQLKLQQLEGSQTTSASETAATDTSPKKEGT